MKHEGVELELVESSKSDIALETFNVCADCHFWQRDCSDIDCGEYNEIYVEKEKPMKHKGIELELVDGHCSECYFRAGVACSHPDDICEAGKIWVKTESIEKGSIAAAGGRLATGPKGEDDEK